MKALDGFLLGVGLVLAVVALGHEAERRSYPPPLLATDAHWTPDSCATLPPGPQPRVKQPRERFDLFEFDQRSIV